MDLFKSLKPTAHPSKNPFDLSQKHVYSTKAGYGLPVAAVECVPSDYIELDIAATLRSQTLNAASFLRGKYTFDAFFVPYSQLWHPFNQFIDQRKDRHTTNQNGISYVPTIQLSKVLKFIGDLYYFSQLDDLDPDYMLYEFCMDRHHYNRALNMVRVLDMLGYGNHDWVFDALHDQETFDQSCNRYKDVYINVFRLAAYHHVFYDYYRNKYYDLEIDGTISPVEDYVYLFNFDDIDCTSFGISHIPVPELSYNFNSMSQDEFNPVDLNQIYRILGLFDIFYVQWKKDLFTSLLPGQQFGSVSSVTIGGVYLASANTGSSSGLSTGYDIGRWEQYNGETWVSPVSSYENVETNINGYNLSNTNSDMRHDHTVPNHNHSLIGVKTNNTAFDVLTLYKAEMLQRWKQATLRAGNMVDDNFRAHYGVTPKFESRNNVVKLGSWEANFQVNPIEATASTGSEVNGAVGDIAATGTSVVSGKAIKFENAGDFGIILVIGYFRPEADYRSTMLDKANTLFEPFDFFTKEFENLGLEAVPVSNYDIVGSRMPVLRNTVLGYAPRYYMYKTAIDKIHRGFYDYQYDMADGLATIHGDFNAWAAPRLEQLLKEENQDFYRDKSTFYVNPNVLDSVFGVNADASVGTDQFLLNVMVSCKAIRPMSELGLPLF